MSDDALKGYGDVAADEAVLGEFGWWLTGGLALAVWTGLALLLTSA